MQSGHPEDPPGPSGPRGHRNPYADLLGLRSGPVADGESLYLLTVRDELLNPNGVLHGGVMYAMADTGMGGAVHSVLESGQVCTTIDIRIAYFRPVNAGEVSCRSKVTHRGRTIAHVESELFAGDAQLARATGTFAILSRWRG